MSNSKNLVKFADFGQAIYVIAICTILGLLPYISFITSIVSLIFLFKALGIIKDINEEFKDSNLSEFRTKYLMSFLLTFIGTIGVAIVAIVMVFQIMGLGFMMDPTGTTMNGSFGGYEDVYALMNTIFTFIGIMLVFVVLIIIAAIFEMNAWKNLNEFFSRYRESFPPYVAQDAIDGTKNLKTAALCFLLFFLIITPIIGIILRIIGYFKLAKLKDLQLAEGHAQGYTPQPAAPVEPDLKFCPHCGAMMEEGGKFCSKCGSKV